MRFRKKPVVIEAVQFTGSETFDEMLAFIGPPNGETPWGMASDEMFIETLEGMMTGRRGWWIIKGVNGEFYPCDPDIFAKTYDPVYELERSEGTRIAREAAMRISAGDDTNPITLRDLEEAVSAMRRRMTGP